MAGDYAVGNNVIQCRQRNNAVVNFHRNLIDDKIYLHCSPTLLEYYNTLQL